MKRVALAALLLGGCTTSATGTAVTVELQNADGVAVVYRDGAGMWQAAERIDARTWRITADDDYQVMATCSSAAGTHQQMLAATVGDGARVKIPCAAIIEREASPFTIRGAMTAAGSISVPGPASVAMTGADLSFEVNPLVERGRAAFADVVVESANRVQIVRGGEMTGDVDLGALDLAGGQPFGSVSVAVAGGELRQVRTVLELDGAAVWANDFDTSTQLSSVRSFGPSARLVPVSELGASDRELIEVSGDQSFASFQVTTDDLAPLRFDLLPSPVGGVTVLDGGVVRADWTSISERTTRIEANAGELGLTVLRGWIDENPDTNGFQLDASAPGFDTTRATATAGSSFATIQERDLATFWSIPIGAPQRRGKRHGGISMISGTPF